MSGRLTLVATLWLRPGQEAAFEALEREAARIMARHGGRIEQAIRFDRPAGGAGGGPFELHIVSFPDQAAFEAYGADSGTLALRPRRDAIIARTELMTGRPAGPYQGVGSGSKSARGHGIFRAGRLRVILAGFSGLRRLTREWAKPRTPARSRVLAVARPYAAAGCEKAKFIRTTARRGT